MNITLQDLIAWRDAMKILRTADMTGIALKTPDFIKCLDAYSTLNSHVVQLAKQITVEVTA